MRRACNVASQPVPAGRDRPLLGGLTMKYLLSIGMAVLLSIGLVLLVTFRPAANTEVVRQALSSSGVLARLEHVFPGQWFEQDYWQVRIWRPRDANSIDPDPIATAIKFSQTSPTPSADIRWMVSTLCVILPVDSAVKSSEWQPFPGVTLHAVHSADECR